MKNTMFAILCCFTTLTAVTANAKSYDHHYSHDSDEYAVGLGLGLLGLAVLLDEDSYGDFVDQRKTYDSGYLYEDEKDNLYWDVTKGNKYTLTTTCDNNCYDVDMTVYDTDNRLVEEDTDSLFFADEAVVEFTAKQSGTYRIEIDMYNCSKYSCRYEIVGNRN